MDGMSDRVPEGTLHGTPHEAAPEAAPEPAHEAAHRVAGDAARRPPCAAVQAFARVLAAAALLLPCAMPLQAADTDRDAERHDFAVIGNLWQRGSGEERLEAALRQTRSQSLSFVLANGIKSAAEPCSDSIYQARRDLLDQARRPLVMLPVASDWGDCVDSEGRHAALERLNRLRELFYPSSTSLGRRKLNMARLSTTLKFRGYPENAHWTVGGVVYATVNLPANNNHYRPEAGRNSEYEDRMVATRFWLKRVFSQARRSGAVAVVLFSEGDLGAQRQRSGGAGILRQRPNQQDGFAEPRKMVQAQVEDFKGKVLLVDCAPPAGRPAISWKGLLGHISVGASVVRLGVRPGSENLFTVVSVR